MMYHLLSCLGLMFILKYGSIFKSLRDFLSARSDVFKELFSCSLCLGFWSGLVVGILTLKDCAVGEYIALPFASAAFCNIVDMLIDKVLEK